MNASANDNQIGILFEDEVVLVINKPAGIVVNRAKSVKEATIQDWAEKRLIASPNDKEFTSRSGVVHRLDKETSGALIIAKTAPAFRHLQEQFSKREVHKFYSALVHGTLPTVEGEINAPVGRLPWNRQRFGVLPGGKEALTRYRVRHAYRSGSTGELYSLLSVATLTGRTHQIRIHMKYLGHAVVADELYAGRKTSKRDLQFCPRLFLHAEKIEFVHPTRGKTIYVSAPLPADLTSGLGTLELLN